MFSGWVKFEKYSFYYLSKLNRSLKKVSYCFTQCSYFGQMKEQKKLFKYKLLFKSLLYIELTKFY